jgi:CRP-like cAMP-binding protein
MTNADSLRKSAVFAGLDGDTLERVAGRFSEVDIPAEQVLIEPRSAGAGLYLICEGTVVVEAHELERELGPGDVVGEISLLEHDGTRRARVIAKTPVRALALGRSDFEQVLGEVPEFAAAIRELAQQRLAELEARH